jgi:hypothetical protein
LEYHSLPLTNEELAELDKYTHKAQDDDNDNVISDEKTLTFQGLEKLMRLIILGTIILCIIILQMLNMSYEMCCHATKQFYKQQCELEPKQL